MLAIDEVPTVSTAAEIGGAGHAFAFPKVRPRVMHPSEMYHPQNRASDPGKILKSKGIFYTWEYGSESRYQHFSAFPLLLRPGRARKSTPLLVAWAPRGSC